MTLSVGDTIWEFWDEGVVYGADVVRCSETDGVYDLLYHGEGFQQDVKLGEGNFSLNPPASGNRDDLKTAGSILATSATGSIRLADLSAAIIDTELRLPLSGVYEQEEEWWNNWRRKTGAASRIRVLAGAFVEFSQQLAPSITTAWWTENKSNWEARCTEARLNDQLRGLVRDLRIRAINWRQVTAHFCSGGASGEEPAVAGSSKEVGPGKQEAAVPEGPKSGGEGEGCPDEDGVEVEAVLYEKDLSDHDGKNGGDKDGQTMADEPPVGRGARQRGLKADKGVDEEAKSLHKAGKAVEGEAREGQGARVRALRARRGAVGTYREVSDDDFEAGEDRDGRADGEWAGANAGSKRSGGQRRGWKGKGKMESESSAEEDSSEESEEWEEEEQEDDEEEKVEEVGVQSAGARGRKRGGQQLKRKTKGGRGKGKGSTMMPVQEDDVCRICQFPGCDSHVLLCDLEGCNCGFHTFCLNPPLHSIPSGDWLCPLHFANVDGALAVKKVETIYGCKEVAPQPLEGTMVQVGVPVTAEKSRLYLVKWENWSHRHNTWVPEEALLYLNDKKVHSFVRKHGRSVHNMDLPIDESKEEWRTVDRVLDDGTLGAARTKKEGKAKKAKLSGLGTLEDGKNYLVKWRGLDYVAATWEGRLEGEDFDAALKAFEKRKNQRGAVALPKLSKRQRGMRAAGEKAWSEVKDLLFEYQVEGVNWLMANFEQSPPRSAILADEMGLGKTIQTAVFLARVRNEAYSLRPALVVAPVSTLTNWENELRVWAPSLNSVIYKGDQESRIRIQKYEFRDGGTPDVVVVGYEIAVADSSFLQKFHWGILVVDEGHKVKDCRSKLATFLQRKIADFRLLLTGTPIQNNLTELFSLLYFINPEKVGNPEEAAERFAKEGNLPMADSGASNQRVAGSINVGTQDVADDDAAARENAVSRLHDLLKPQMLRRLKKNVLKLPPRKLIEVPCALSPLQRSLYVDILERNHEALFSGVHAGKKRSLTNALVNLKLICNHPYLFPGVEPEVAEQEKMRLMITASGKFQLLAKLLPKLKEKGHRTLVFSQSTLLLNLLEDLMHSLALFFFRLDGSTPQTKRQQQIDAFNKPDAREFVYLISTRAGGLGINLQTADTVIIYDPDYNPFADEQAQARAHRIGQEKPVQVYQLFTKCTVEERILEKAHKKLRMERIVMNVHERVSETPEEIHSLLTHGAEKILDDQGSLEITSIVFTDEDLERLMDRTVAEEPATEEGAQGEGGYLGSVQGPPAELAADAQEGGAAAEAEDDEDEMWKRLLAERVAKREEALRAQLASGLGKRQRKTINYRDGDSSTDEDENDPNRPRKRGRPRKGSDQKRGRLGEPLPGGEPAAARIMAQQDGGEGRQIAQQQEEDEWTADGEATEDSESNESLGDEGEGLISRTGYGAENMRHVTSPIQQAESKAPGVVYYNGNPLAKHVSYLSLPPAAPVPQQLPPDNTGFAAQQQGQVTSCEQHKATGPSGRQHPSSDARGLGPAHQRDGLCSANMPGTEYRGGGSSGAMRIVASTGGGVGPPSDQILPRLDTSPAAHLREGSLMMERLTALKQQELKSLRERCGGLQQINGRSVNSIRRTEGRVEEQLVAAAQGSLLAQAQAQGIALPHGQAHGSAQPHGQAHGGFQPHGQARASAAQPHGQVHASSQPRRQAHKSVQPHAQTHGSVQPHGQAHGSVQPRGQAHGSVQLHGQASGSSLPRGQAHGSVQPHGWVHGSTLPQWSPHGVILPHVQAQAFAVQHAQQARGVAQAQSIAVQQGPQARGVAQAQTSAVQTSAVQLGQQARGLAQAQTSAVQLGQQARGLAQAQTSAVQHGQQATGVAQVQSVSAQHAQQLRAVAQAQGISPQHGAQTHGVSQGVSAAQRVQVTPARGAAVQHGQQAHGIAPARGISLPPAISAEMFAQAQINYYQMMTRLPVPAAGGSRPARAGGEASRGNAISGGYPVHAIAGVSRGNTAPVGGSSTAQQANAVSGYQARAAGVPGKVASGYQGNAGGAYGSIASRPATTSPPGSGGALGEIDPRRESAERLLRRAALERAEASGTVARLGSNSHMPG